MKLSNKLSVGHREDSDDFSEMYDDGTRDNSHETEQGTFYSHMGKMGKQMSQ